MVQVGAEGLHSTAVTKSAYFAGNPEKLTITTPLFYANGSPHIGTLTCSREPACQLRFECEESNTAALHLR